MKRREGAIRYVAVVVAIVATTLATGFAPEDGKLFFVDEEPLELTLEQAKAGAKVVACNIDKEKTLTGLKAQVMGFNLSSPDDVSMPTKPEDTLPPEACADLQIKAADSLNPKPGQYQGLLVLSSSNTENSIRQVVITVPQAEKTEVSVAAKPITSTNAWPMGLHPGSVERELQIPLRVLKGKIDPSKANGLIGTLSGGPKPGYVSVISNMPSSTESENAASSSASHFDNLQAVPISSRSGVVGEGITEVPVKVTGLEGVGTYSGTLTVDGVNFDTQVLVTDSPWWAVGAMVCGLLIGGALLVLTRRFVPRWRLQQRSDKLKDKYKKAESDFYKALGVRQQNSKSAQQSRQGVLEDVIEDVKRYKVDEDNVEAYQDRFSRALTVYASNNVFLDTSADDFKELVKMLETAEADARHLGDPNGFAKSLKDLKAALESFATFLQDEVKPVRNPALVSPASALLKGGPLAVGAAKEISERAQGYINLIGVWRKSWAPIKRYVLWAIHLSEKFANDEKSANTDPPKEHKEMLRDAGAKVIEAQNELLDAQNASTLTELGGAEDLKAAYKTLAYLGSRYGVWEDPEALKSQEQRSQEADRLVSELTQSSNIDFAPLLQGSFRMLGQRDFNVTEWVSNAALPVLPKPEPRAEVGHLFRGAGLLLSLILAFLVAVLALVVQVYPAGVFGTFKDYVSAIVVGATSTVAIGFLQGPLAQLFTRLRS